MTYFKCNIFVCNFFCKPMQSRGQTNHFESTNVGGYNIVNSEKKCQVTNGGRYKSNESGCRTGHLLRLVTLKEVYSQLAFNQRH